MENFQPRGVELNPVHRVEIFCDLTWKISTYPGVETLYYTFSASIPGNKIAFILFSSNKWSLYHASSNNSW